MAKFESVQVQGLDQLAMALRELPQRVARNGLRAAVYAGAKVIRDEVNSQDAWYWRFVEFGTVKMSARPFLRPAFDMKKHEAVTAIKTRLAQRIEQAAQELKK